MTKTERLADLKQRLALVNAELDRLNTEFMAMGAPFVIAGAVIVGLVSSSLVAGIASCVVFLIVTLIYAWFALR